VIVAGKKGKGDREGCTGWRLIDSWMVIEVFVSSRLDISGREIKE
jgi:hypothetical protein